MMSAAPVIALKSGFHSPSAEPSWGSPPEPGSPRLGPQLYTLGHSIKRRIKLIVLTLVVLNIVAFLGVRALTPRYTASADVIVGPREEQVVDLKAVLSGLSGSSDVIESEVELLRSREIARGVVKTLNLDQTSEFNTSLREPGLREHLAEAASTAAAWLGDLLSELSVRVGISDDARSVQSTSVVAPRITADPLETIDPLSKPVDRFLSQLAVSQKGRSRVITISFTSTDASLAAQVPNTIAEAYITGQLRAKTDATLQATKWLDDRVAELRQQLLDADEAVEAYRRQAKIVPIRDSTLLNQQISETGQELMRAQEQVATAQGRLAAASSINPSATGLNRDLEEAKGRQRAIEGNIANLQRQIDSSNQSEIGLRSLQREADAYRNLYEKLLARARETKVQSGLQQADASLISRAERPEGPSFPKAAVILPLFFIASCVLIVLLVIWLESLDRGFSTLEQMEAELGIAAIGAIPFIKRGLRQRDPRSLFLEAIRNVYTSLLLSDNGKSTKTVLIASALPGEGKSSLAVAMAGILAAFGKRIVVVDCDLRKPLTGKIFDVPRGAPGLTEYLSGRETQLDAILRQEATSSVHVLPAGNDALAPPGLLGSNAMREMLQVLSLSFDLVILDSGPVLQEPDSLHLSRLVDKTIFAVRWEATRCAVARAGLRHLIDAGANVVGTLLTMVDPKEHRKHAFGKTHAQHLMLNPRA